MPIYEFYCPRCHTIYSFLSRTIQPDKRPACPRCRTFSLERQVSLFATTGRSHEDAAAEGDESGFDEQRMEAAVEELASEAETVNEEDPRQLAGLMRKFSARTGMDLGPGMEEALRRLEAGEDPEAIEEELGDQLGDEEPFTPANRSGERARRRRTAPQRDTTLYEM